MIDAKIRVAVIYGGRSGEHKISLRSARSVIAHLDVNKYRIIPVAIDKDGRWYVNDTSILQGPNSDELLVSDANSIQAIPHADPNEQRHFDVIFPVLHGKMGEDGTVQGLFELAGIPYVGCGVLSSAIGMDKDVAKRLVKALDIPVADYFVLRHPQEKEGALAKINASFGFPVFVKPANCGSSDGVSKVDNAAELNAAIDLAFSLDKKVLVEKAINARDVEISVLESLDGSEPLTTDVAGEIVHTRTGFYNKAAKFDASYFPTTVVPANVTPEQLATIQKYAKQIFQALECEGLTRVDFFIDRDNGDIIFNEVNTLPGFTNMSLYPQMWQASGMPYEQLLDHLINLALRRRMFETPQAE